MQKWFEFSLKYRPWLAAIICLLTLLAAFYFFTNFTRSDNSLPVWFKPADPALQTYNKLVHEFGPDRFVVAAFEVGNAFDGQVLHFVDELTKTLEELPEIAEVASLSTIQTLKSEQDTLTIAPLMPEGPLGADFDQIKNQALADPDIANHLVTTDGKIINFIIQVNTEYSFDQSRELKNKILDIIRKKNGHNYPFHLSGSPIVDEAFNRLVVRDQTIFFPATLLLVIIILVFIFRSWRLAAGALALQVVVLLWILALYFYLGFSMNVVSGLFCSIIITVCTTNSIHLVLEYQRLLSKGDAPEKAACVAHYKIVRPCLFTALTTIAGLLAFTGSTIPPIQHLGLFTAAGVLLALGFTIFILPSWLPRLACRWKIMGRTDLWNRCLHFLAMATTRHAFATLFIFTVLTIMALVGVFGLKIETNFFEYFLKNEKARQDLEFFEHNLSGVARYDIILDSTEPIAKNPEVLKKIDGFTAWVENDGVTKQVFSHVGLIKKINHALNHQNPESYRVPDSQNEIAQILLLLESSGKDEIEKYRTPDYQTIHLKAQAKWLSSEKMRPYLKNIENYFENNLKSLGIAISITGHGPLWVQLDRQILLSQVVSILSALVIILLMLMVFLKSIKMGLVALVPNIIPIIFTLGFMGWFGIHLNVATVMIAAVTLGITVDDTIYYLSRFKKNLQKTAGDIPDSILQTHTRIGKAILHASLVLMVGFGILCLGSFTPTIYFGSMVALTFFFAIIGELLLLPALLMMVGRKGRLKTVPVFEGETKMI